MPQEVLEAPSHLEGGAVWHPPCPKVRLNAVLLECGELLLQECVEEGPVVACDHRVCKGPNRELSAGQQAINFRREHLGKAGDTATEHLAHLLQWLVTEVASARERAAVTPAAIPRCVPVGVKDRPRVALGLAEGFRPPRTHAAPEVLEGRLYQVDVELHAAPREVRAPEELRRRLQPLQDGGLICEADTRSHVSRLVHDGQSADCTLRLLIERLYPANECGDDPEARGFQRNAGVPNVGLLLPEGRSVRPDAVVRAVGGAPRQGVQVQNKPQAVVRRPAQDLLQPVPRHRRQRHVPHVEGIWNEHCVGGRVVRAVDPSADRRQGVRKGRPREGQPHLADAKRSEQLEVSLSDEGVPVGLEDVNGLQSTIGAVEVLRQHAL
mmetsp:Transcript_76788/g.212163  ORF Transcript_76788/g.212163 Transcript_76788/m.212163 type:complete len:381 (-) Transcript_76788:619-1761(-)